MLVAGDADAGGEGIKSRLSQTCFYVVRRARTQVSLFSVVLCLILVWGAGRWDVLRGLRSSGMCPG
jgi:hypothetical protein